jgi:hypothetical protein
MSKPVSALEGTVTIPPEAVNELVRVTTGLPPSFFVTVGRAKVEQDGGLTCKFTASTEGAPPPPAANGTR